MSALTVLEELHRADPSADRIDLHALNLDRFDDSTLQFIRDQFPLTRDLDLRDNALTSLPRNLGAFVPQLVVLDVRNNPLVSIPELSETLATCASLQSLNVTLQNKTDESVLRVMLPRLRHLNGQSLGDDVRPPLLSLAFVVSPTSSSNGANSPGQRWLDTPSSAASSAVRPVRSPQEKRELRIHLAAQTKNSTKSAQPISLKRQESTRPTELPATISDENTDWRKLLKQTTAAVQKETNRARPTWPIAEEQELEEEEEVQAIGNGETTTRVFIAELKAIVRAFQKRPDKAVTSSSTEDGKALDQLDRRIDQLALQLNDLEKAPATGTEDGHVATASLAVRWRLLETGARYATHKVGTLDRSLGTGLHRLLQTQTRVVEALLRHVNSAIHAQHKWEKASASHAQVAEQQKQQMKLLLDVAETLENDLEALQVKYQAEKAQREQAQAAWEQLRAGKDGITSSIVSVEPTERRVRKRPEVLTETKPRIEPEPTRAVLPVSPPRAQNPPIVRNLTVKQVVDLIHCILTSKSKYDVRTQAIGAPPETVEQHMYTYLNQRFGLQPLIVDYASAIWKATQMYTRDDNDVAMFHAMLRNHVDEDFVGIKKKLQGAIRELLRAYFQAKQPLKAEPVIQKLVQARVVGGGLIFEDEWTELLLYLYDPSDSSILMRLVKRKAELFFQSQQPNGQERRTRSTTSPPQPPIGLPFPQFEKILYDYQLQGRLKLLESFRGLFGELDSERVGVLTRAQFRQLVAKLSPRERDGEVHKMMDRVDPFDHDTVTFSDAVRCLLPEIRQHSVSKRSTAAMTKDAGSKRQEACSTGITTTR